MALKETKAPRQSRSVISKQRDHEHGAYGQGVSQLLDGAFDKTGRAQQRRMVLHALLGQRRRKRIELLLERPRDLERIGTVLRGGLDENAGLAGDQGIAESRLGAFAHCRHVAEAHRQAAARADHRLPQGFERGAGRLRLDHDALRGRFEIAPADQLGRALGRRHDIIEGQVRPRPTLPDRLRSAARALRRRKSAPAPRREPRGSAA